MNVNRHNLNRMPSLYTILNHFFLWPNHDIYMNCYQELQREYAVASVGLRSEVETERKQAELEHRIQRRMLDAERERELEVKIIYYFLL